MTRVVIVGIAGDERTDRMREQLASVEGLSSEYEPCPRSLGEVVQLPFVREETGRSYFGVPAIERFLARQRAL